MNSAFHTTKYLANNVTTSPNKRKREQIENTTPSAASTALTSFKNIFRKKVCSFILVHFIRLFLFHIILIVLLSLKFLFK